jgi:hypothetical protein
MLPFRCELTNAARLYTQGEIPPLWVMFCNVLPDATVCVRSSMYSILNNVIYFGSSE